ncbi:hypothetical protein HGRIS_006574 [Hohenbuehelia grisea]|uniref:Uncharacterized protein n=1 Tax=Hohenbuehelia grisea TaxID=104357 RepID=A0ABR3J9F6_9AGAR
MAHLNLRFQVLILFFVAFARHAAAYFVVTTPTTNTVWKNGAANGVSWRKGVLDGIDHFDVQLTRMGQNGLFFIARNVEATTTSFNIFMQDVPPADDYYLLFVNSTHGVMHATSKKFTISGSSDSASSSNDASPVNGAPTVTVSGGPHPTKQSYATTFAAVANLASRVHASSLLAGNPALGWGVASLIAAFISGICMLL